MKKMFYFALMAMMMAGFISCAKGEDPAEGIDIEKTFDSRATIEGIATLNSNQSGSSYLQFAPQGTKLTFTILNSAFLAGLQGSYIATTTVGTNGRYSIELPARSDGTAVAVTINADPVIADIQSGPTTANTRFTFTAVTENIQPNVKYNRTINYTSAVILQNQTWVNGTVNVRLTYNNGSANLPAPSGTQVQVTIARTAFVPERANDLVYFETVGDDGVLTITRLAPTIQMSSTGITLTLSSSFVGTRVNVTPNVRHIYSLPAATTVRLYGGVTYTAAEVAYTQGAAI